jgi:hypothetical protein
VRTNALIKMNGSEIPDKGFKFYEFRDELPKYTHGHSVHVEAGELKVKASKGLQRWESGAFRPKFKYKDFPSSSLVTLVI